MHIQYGKVRSESNEENLPVRAKKNNQPTNRTENMWLII